MIRLITIFLLVAGFTGIIAQEKVKDMGYLELDNARIYYEIYGEGSPLLLIAGLASDSQSWQSILEGLSKNHQVIIYDNRTTGRTTSSESDLTLSIMANDAVKLLDHLKIDKAAIAGHSMGGIVGMRVASKYPDRVNKLIIAASPLRISDRNRILFDDLGTMLDEGISKRRWFRNLFYWIFTPGFFNDTQLVDSALDYAVDYPNPQSDEGFRMQVHAINDFDGTDICREIQCPTLVVAGRLDIIFPIGDCRELSEAIPNATLHVIEGAAHSIHSEKPLEFVKAVEDFLH